MNSRNMVFVGAKISTSLYGKIESAVIEERRRHPENNTSTSSIIRAALEFASISGGIGSAPIHLDTAVDAIRPSGAAELDDITTNYPGLRVRRRERPSIEDMENAP